MLLYSTWGRAYRHITAVPVLYVKYTVELLHRHCGFSMDLIQVDITKSEIILSFFSYFFSPVAVLNIFFQWGVMKKWFDNVVSDHYKVYIWLLEWSKKGHLFSFCNHF